MIMWIANVQFVLVLNPILLNINYINYALHNYCYNRRNIWHR
jgi:hypothetical protein